MLWVLQLIRIFVNIFCIDTSILDMLFFFLWHFTTLQFRCKHIFVCACGCVCAQSHLTLCKPIDCSLPGSSVCGIFQAKILEQAAISYSRGSSWLRDQTWVPLSPALAGGFFTTAPGKLIYIIYVVSNKVLLFSSGNYIQYPMINHNGKESRKESVYITESLCCMAEISITL